MQRRWIVEETTPATETPWEDAVILVKGYTYRVRVVDEISPSGDPMTEEELRRQPEFVDGLVRDFVAQAMAGLTSERKRESTDTDPQDLISDLYR